MTVSEFDRHPSPAPSRDRAPAGDDQIVVPDERLVEIVTDLCLLAMRDAPAAGMALVQAGAPPVAVERALAVLQWAVTDLDAGNQEAAAALATVYDLVEQLVVPPASRAENARTMDGGRQLLAPAPRPGACPACGTTAPHLSPVEAEAEADADAVRSDQ